MRVNQSKDLPPASFNRCPSERRRGLHVLVSDEQSVVRDGLVRLLNKGPDLSARGASLEDLPSPDEQPDVILCVVASQSELSKALVKVQTKYPDAKTLAFLLSDDEATSLAALRSGVQGVVHHGVTASELDDCIRQVMGGDFAISNQLARRLAKIYQTRETTPRVTTGVGELTQREAQVLGLLANGATNREIAARLTLSEHTVRAHLRGIMQKLGVSNRVQAAALAWQGKLSQRSDAKE